MAIEFAESRTPGATLAELLWREAFQLGLNLGSDPDSVTLSPPLVTTAEEMDAAMAILADALRRLPGG
jgi:4-aminobutyrate aminotransferase-like enzyme